MDINDVLPSKTLFSTFKHLTLEETMKVREVCKEWLRLIDENQTFWREVYLVKKGVQMIQAVVDQFDQLSNSTSKEVFLQDVELGEYADVERLVQSLFKSKETLSAVFITESDVSDNQSSRITEKPGLKDRSISNLRNLMVLAAVLESCARVKVNLSIVSTSSKTRFHSLNSHPDSSPSTNLNLFDSHPDIFNSLQSLHVCAVYSHSTWRNILSKPSQTLRHLNFKTERVKLGEDLTTLEFSKLEFLEISDGLWQFPTWMKVPTSLKLYSSHLHSNSPSISELWVDKLDSWTRLSSRCPHLKVLRFQPKKSFRSENFSAHAELLDVLKARKDNVDGGVEVEGVKTESLQNLVVPFNKLDPATLKKCAELVSKVVDLNAKYWRDLDIIEVGLKPL